MTDQNSQFFAILTAVGESKQANADALGIPWKLSSMGVGDANGTDPIPNRLQTRLINERRWAPLNQVSIDPQDASIIIAEQVIPPDVGGWWIREIGLYDSDNDLVAVANCAPSYKPLLSQGTGKTQVVRLNLVVTSSAKVQLKIDPAVVLATRDYVDKAILNVLPPNKVAGTFTQVRVNDRGVVQQGFNPTTLEGYGITNALKTGVTSYQRPILSGLGSGSAAESGGALEIREAQEVGDSNKGIAYAPRIIFHWTKVISGDLGMDSLGDLMWKGNKLYHAGNFNPANKADKATTLAGYGITDAFTKAETYNKTDTKYLIDQAVLPLATKATTLAGYGIADAFTKTESYNRADTKSLIDQAVLPLATKATTLAGYGIADAFTKTESYNRADTKSLIDQAVLPLATKATTLAGYGITDAFTKTETYNRADTKSLIDQAVLPLAAKATTLAGYGITDAFTKADTYNKTDTKYLIDQAVLPLAAKATTLAGYGITNAFAKTETYNRADIEYLIAQAVGALLPKRTFGVTDFIRVPDVPGGLIVQFGSIQLAPETTLDVTLPIAFNLTRGALATMSLDAVTSQGVYSAYSRLINERTIRLTHDVTSYTGAATQYVNWWAWGN